MIIVQNRFLSASHWPGWWHRILLSKTFRDRVLVWFELWDWLYTVYRLAVWRDFWVLSGAWLFFSVDRARSVHKSRMAGFSRVESGVSTCGGLVDEGVIDIYLKNKKREGGGVGEDRKCQWSCSARVVLDESESHRRRQTETRFDGEFRNRVVDRWKEEEYPRALKCQSYLIRCRLEMICSRKRSSVRPITYKVMFWGCTRILIEYFNCGGGGGSCCFACWWQDTKMWPLMVIFFILLICLLCSLYIFIELGRATQNNGAATNGLSECVRGGMENNVH